MGDSNTEREQPRIPMDGSYGVGINSELTIITKAPNGAEREETFTVPAVLVNYEALLFHYRLNLILGFKLMKNDRIDNPDLKELGL